MPAAPMAGFLERLILTFGKPNVNVESISSQRLKGTQLLCLAMSKPSGQLSAPSLTASAPAPHTCTVLLLSWLWSQWETQRGSWESSIKRGRESPLMGAVLCPSTGGICKPLLTSLSFREWHKMRIWLFGPQTSRRIRNWRSLGNKTEELWERVGQRSGSRGECDQISDMRWS